jgi:hypothetical protein
MAHWLSLWRMNRIWQRWFSRASAALVLLLAASLAHAGSVCVSAFGAKTAGLVAAGQSRCLTAGAARNACILAPQRIDVRAAAVEESSPEPLPAAGTAQHAAGIFRTVAELQAPAGLAPASPVPVHILLRRYLS